MTHFDSSLTFGRIFKVYKKPTKSVLAVDYIILAEHWKRRPIKSSRKSVIRQRQSRKHLDLRKVPARGKYLFSMRQSLCSDTRWTMISHSDKPDRGLKPKRTSRTRSS